MYYHYDSRSQKTIPIMALGPNSLTVVTKKYIWTLLGLRIKGGSCEPVSAVASRSRLSAGSLALALKV